VGTVFPRIEAAGLY